jgi:cysteine dioxygenase
VAVDIEAHAAPAPPASPPPLLALSSAVARAVDECKRAGVAVNADQPAASFAELDARVRGLLAGYLAAGHADWRQYAQWNEHHYTRHLVDSCDEYELMLICWAPGQRSRVHNHAGSHCWLTVVDGGVEESLYAPVAAGGGGEERSAAPALPGVLGATRPCPPLHHLATAQLGAGGVAYINDKVALHAVGCPQICPGQGAVTLHLYCPPIRRVNLFEEDNNRVVQRVPGFFTVRGQKSAAA